MLSSHSKIFEDEGLKVGSDSMQTACKQYADSMRIFTAFFFTYIASTEMFKTFEIL